MSKRREENRIFVKNTDRYASLKTFKLKPLTLIALKLSALSIEPASRISRLTKLGKAEADK